MEEYTLTDPIVKSETTNQFKVFSLLLDYRTLAPGQTVAGQIVIQLRDNTVELGELTPQTRARVPVAARTGVVASPRQVDVAALDARELRLR